MVVGNKDKRGRKKEKEGWGFGRLPSFFFPPFSLVSHNHLIPEIFLVQIWSFFIFSGFKQFRILKILNSELNNSLQSLHFKIENP